MSDHHICECGKECLSKKEAGTIINLAKKYHHRSKTSKHIPKRFYRCKTCGTYHTTHQPVGFWDSEQAYYERDKR